MKITIDGLKFDEDSSEIAKDLLTGEYIVKNNAAKIAVSVTKKSSGNYSWEYGYSQFRDYFPAVRLKDGKEFPIASVEVAEGVFEECQVDGNFYEDSSQMPCIPFKYASEPNFLSSFKYRKLSKDCFEKMKQRLGELSPTYSITEGKRYTFGVELETCSGYIPHYLYASHNISCTRDGSIDGGEYVTGVLRGDRGIEHLQEIVHMLAKRCEVDKKCGIHVHIGNASFDKRFIVFAYYLGRAIQDELYAIMPKSRKLSTYCRYIDRKLSVQLSDFERDFDGSLDQAYAELFLLLSHGKPESSKLNRKTNHPRGSKAGYDHSSPRYWWLNLIPTVFNTRECDPPVNTVEFRQHSASLNFNKIKNWLKICMAFVYFVENHQYDIIAGEMKGTSSPINLETIIKVAYPKTHSTLISYIRKRKLIFNSSADTESMEYDREDSRNQIKAKVKDMIV